MHIFLKKDFCFVMYFFLKVLIINIFLLCYITIRNNDAYSGASRHPIPIHSAT
jgi:hypothetical protein